MGSREKSYEANSGLHDDWMVQTGLWRKWIDGEKKKWPWQRTLIGIAGMFPKIKGGPWKSIEEKRNAP